MNVTIVKKGGYGDRFGLLHEEGAVVDFPDALAAKLIIHRIAVKVDEPERKRAAVTTAAFAPPENEAMPAPRKVGRPRKVQEK